MIPYTDGRLNTLSFRWVYITEGVTAEDVKPYKWKWIHVEAQIQMDSLVEPIWLCPRRVPLDREIVIIFINV